MNSHHKVLSAAVLTLVTFSLRFIVASENLCSNVEGVNNFTASAFSGRWYEIKRAKSFLDKFVESCASIEFLVNSDDKATIELRLNVMQQNIDVKGAAVVVSDGAFNWVFTLPLIGSNCE